MMKLEFEKSEGTPRKGAYVALHNIFPVTSKGGLGLVVAVKKDSLGFNYGVFEFYDKKIYYHHISTLITLKTKMNFTTDKNK
jgi:hypothetical protein